MIDIFPGQLWLWCNKHMSIDQFNPFHCSCLMLLLGRAKNDPSDELVSFSFRPSWRVLGSAQFEHKMLFDNLNAKQIMTVIEPLIIGMPWSLAEISPVTADRLRHSDEDASDAFIDRDIRMLINVSKSSNLPIQTMV